MQLRRLGAWMGVAGVDTPALEVPPPCAQRLLAVTHLAMLRFLLLLTSVMLLLGLPVQAAPSVLIEQASEADHHEDEGDCHCCGDASESSGDCCDRALGACCAPGMAVALAASSPNGWHPATTPPAPQSFLPVHLLRPRDNGPPPTPPPIG